MANSMPPPVQQYMFAFEHRLWKKKTEATWRIYPGTLHFDRIVLPPRFKAEERHRRRERNHPSFYLKLNSSAFCSTIK